MTAKIPFFPTSRAYRPVGRKLLQVDELQKCELPRYHRDIASRSFVIPKRGTVPSSIVEADELLVPTFEIASNPVVKMHSAASTPYDLCEATKNRSCDSISRQEDIEVFRVLNAAVPADHAVYVAPKLRLENLRTALTLLEEHELFGGAIVMHQQMWYHIDAEAHPQFKPCSVEDIRDPDREPIYGYFYNVPIYVSTMCMKNAAFIIAEKEYVGVMPIRTDLTVLPADDPKKLRLGWVIFQEIGMGIVNDYAVARVMTVREDQLVEIQKGTEAGRKITGIDAATGLYAEHLSHRDSEIIAEVNRQNKELLEDTTLRRSGRLTHDQVDALSEEINLKD